MIGFFNSPRRVVSCCKVHSSSVLAEALVFWTPNEVSSDLFSVLAWAAVARILMLALSW